MAKTFFINTLREAPKGTESISAQLLLRAGFISQLAAGIYSLLPLGWKTHQKISQIIRDEMDVLGSEVHLPVLQPKELWLKTNRWQTIDPPLFTTRDRHKKEYALAPTHEEVITDIVRGRVKSAKDLPFMLYQIQVKFRNELRATSGLLRTREFIMKDAYSFHQDKKDLEIFYQKMIDAYQNIFKLCGLETILVEASSGTIGGDISHEFMVLSATGEDRVVQCQKCHWAANFEIGQDKKRCPKCQGQVKIASAIEVGHIFQLGTKYSDKMGANFIDLKGKSQAIWMGCYGIGIGRLLAAIVEVHHDDKGIQWPTSVAPFQVYLASLDKSQSLEQAQKLAKELQNQGFEVLLDDRAQTPGVKFADADLIGLPVRLVISPKTLKNQTAEIKLRSDAHEKIVPLGRVVKELSRMLK